jgi:hypothetical protein
MESDRTLRCIRIREFGSLPCLNLLPHGGLSPGRAQRSSLVLTGCQRPGWDCVGSLPPHLTGKNLVELLDGLSGVGKAGEMLTLPHDLLTLDQLLLIGSSYRQLSPERTATLVLE